MKVCVHGHEKSKIWTQIKLLGTLSSRNVDGQSSSIFGSVLVIFWRLLGKCQITYCYLQKASSRLWPPLKYVMNVFILSSEIFVVICTKVFQICTCIFHIFHGVTWQLHSNQNTMSNLLLTVYTNTLPTSAH